MHLLFLRNAIYAWETLLVPVVQDDLNVTVLKGRLRIWTFSYITPCRQTLANPQRYSPILNLCSVTFLTACQDHHLSYLFLITSRFYITFNKFRIAPLHLVLEIGSSLRAKTSTWHLFSWTRKKLSNLLTFLWHIFSRLDWKTFTIIHCNQSFLSIRYKDLVEEVDHCQQFEVFDLWETSSKASI